MPRFDRCGVASVPEPPGIRGVGAGMLGISAIVVYEPPWRLGNDWFGEGLPRKFAQHTGIQSRWGEMGSSLDF